PSSEYTAPNRFGLAGKTAVTDHGVNRRRRARITAVSGGLEVALAQSGSYRVDILNPRGQRVARLHDGQLNAGKTRFSTEQLNLTAGYYIVQLRGETVLRSFEMIR
ncbi:MAG: hypothetical protein ACQEQV_04765, partial [Fibrobacterota bacterium]